MDPDFQGRAVLITGGAGDIGRAAARRFQEGGARVVLLDSNAAALDSALGELPGAEARRVDVTNLAEVDAAFAEIHSALGRIDVLVNCAGIYRHRLVAEMSEEEWDETLSVNLRGVFAACRAAGKIMAAQEGGGSIVNLASIAAQRGSPLHAHYAASKAGIIGFGRGLAMELAPKVRVNAVAPGIIESRMIREMRETRGEEWMRQIPLERSGTPDEVADAICFLASDRAAYINGAVLNVNGGMWMD
ncbi:MAG: SDR family NAD(P)-dependent oxidoreductase [bacterium]